MSDGYQTSAESLWGFPSPGESRWPAAIAVVVALAIQALLPDTITAGPRWVVPILEALLLVPLMIANPTQLTRTSRDMQTLSVALIGLVNAANLISLALLVHQLLKGKIANGHALILSGVGIWLTIVIVFGLWLWEVDRGGPMQRLSNKHAAPDLFFPQMENPGLAKGRWYPSFLDYLYVSLTNATAFSPTDTLPLTTRAKALMGIESVASLATVAIVGARAVNILK
jgi:uncharacterized membrane protein